MPVVDKRIPAESEFKQRLLAMGLLKEVKLTSSYEDSPQPRRLVKSSGKSASELLLEDRR